MNKEKEFYKLWIGYLKQSEAYQTLYKSLSGRLAEIIASSDFKPPPGLALNYALFGNIFASDFSFEKWWKNRHKYRASSRANIPVMLTNFEQQPTPETNLYLTIDPTFPDNDIVKEVKRLLKEKRKRPFVQKIIEWKKMEQGLPSQTYLRLDELKRYLEIYKLFKSGMSYKKIMEKYEHIGYELRTCQRDIQNAKQIIRNAEWGVFPGKF
jgi:hypothetical protein